MQKIFHITAALFSMSFFAGGCFGQSALKESETASLCSLQQKVTEGNHETVQVSGIFSEGLERGTLEDAACPKESTWVELDLRSKQNKEKLRKLLGRSRRAYVVVEGEFYGPPLPDSKLPYAIRNSYHPGWGHLAAFKTKLVVHSIRDVKAAPIDQANKNQQSPQVTHADMPLYPPMARVAHVSGTVQVKVTIKDGAVVETEQKSSAHPILINTT